MPDLPDWSQSVSIDAASVTITVSGAVTIASGSVTIANASIAVINATGTKITSARPPKELGYVAGFNTIATGTLTLDADVQALVIQLNFTLSNYKHVKVAWHPSMGGGVSWLPFEIFTFNQAVFVVPVLPATRDSNSNVLTQIDVTVDSTGSGGFGGAVITEIFEGAPEWLTIFPQPQLEPNQTPLGFAKVGFAGQSAAWIITAAANIQVSLFNLTVTRRQGTTDGTLWYVGQGSALPVATPTTWLIKAETMAAISPWSNLPFAGAQLTRGNGLWVWNDDLAAGTLSLAATLQYSLS